jgi:hypothetical protein
MLQGSTHKHDFFSFNFPSYRVRHSKQKNSKNSKTIAARDYLLYRRFELQMVWTVDFIIAKLSIHLKNNNFECPKK